MRKLLTAYGDLMVAIGVWFMKRGERYATWIEFVPRKDHDKLLKSYKNYKFATEAEIQGIPYHWNSATEEWYATHCGCAECD